ncbi:MAG TPA: sulfatase-like hydrolase/transferase [Steroidobacteraceae bacterium]|nr:sulfatase-like hydrolase/transferase [Steroidobacteraceae bacterium]
MDRRASIKLIGGAAAALALGPVRPARTAARPDTRPSIILIIIDDMRWDEFGAGGHPYLETPHIDRLAREGASFSQVIHATPLCSPNRACLLTGQYVARHGVYNNADRSLLSHLLPTFPQELKRAGYTTALVGKWHMGNDPTPRPGFDYWVSFAGQGKIVDPELFEKGRLEKVSGYVTDLLTDRALEFIRSQRGTQRPYFLCLAHKALHPDAIQRNDGSLDTQFGSRYIAADRHRGRYQDEIFPRAKVAKSAAQGVTGSAMVERFLVRKQSEANLREFGGMLDPGTSEQSIRDRAEMMLSVDEGLGGILAELEESGTLDQTAIIFGSDNGFFFGEHGLSIERRLPYEEAVRAPLLVRYPPLVKAGSRIGALVSSIDVAPTILQLGAARIGAQVQGISFLPLLTSGEGRSAHRSSALIENFSDDRPFPWVLDADYKAIRTDRHKLIHWIQHPELDELYDLGADPREDHNLLNDPRHRALAARLRADLGQLVRQSIAL